mmetsp:Transcript_14778/g.22388  ORF Transcript_14778/g.22388 Transcript_14778/m.22388 type:complete len:616 (+) Transcript_14778:115-1962(+)
MVFAPRESAEDIGWGSRHHHRIESSCTVTEQKPSIIHKDLTKNSTSIVSNETRKQRKLTRENRTQLKKKLKLQGSEKSQKAPNEKETDVSYDHYGTFPQTCPSSAEESFQIGINVVSKTDGDSDVQVPTSIVTFEPSDRSSQIAIIGRAKIAAIEGSIQIFGYTLTSASQKTLMVDSPSWMSSLCISNFSDDRGQYAKIKVMSMEREMSYQLLPMKQVRSPVVIDERWDTTAKRIIEDLNTDIPNLKEGRKRRSNRILVSGAKNVGKSTFVKFICNKILSNSKASGVSSVAILDCDVGQPEFSPPSLLSLTVLTQPLLCPSHAHMVCGDSSTSYATAEKHHSAFYYGSNSPKMNPISFSHAVKELMNDYITMCGKSDQNIPLIINTDGWVKGMGFEILSSTIDIVNPGHIVQILGSTKAKFFDLTSHASLERTIHVVFSHSMSRKEDVSLATTNDSPPTGTQEKHKDSKLLRNLRLCVYFLGGYNSFIETGASFEQCGIVDDDCNIAMKLARMKPYAISFDAISCVVMDEDGNSSICLPTTEEDVDYIYDVFNGSIVGLCSNMDKCKNLHRSIGLGIVRSIDRSRRLFLHFDATFSTKFAKSSHKYSSWSKSITF